MGSWSWMHWVVVLVIVLLVFGTKRLTSGARDLGRAYHEFKKGVKGDEKDPDQLPNDASDSSAGQDARSKQDSNKR